MIKTKDFQQFKTILSNREVDETHVVKLMTSITKNNMLHLNPIIVNNRKEVIDGQHRLEAATRLKVDIYYIMDDDVNKKDISTLNSNSKKWTVNDYINFYTTEGKPEYKKLSKFMNQHQFLKANDAARMLSTDSYGLSAVIREGLFIADNEWQAQEIISEITKLKELTPIVTKRQFIGAYTKAFRHEDFDSKAFLSTAEQQPRSIVKCVNEKQALEMIEELYNYRRQNRIKLTK